MSSIEQRSAVREVSIARAEKLLRRYIAKKKSVMLWGAPGIGKSSIVQQVAVLFGWKVIDFRANIREPVDLRGIPVANLKLSTTQWLPPDELPRVDRDGEEGILFIDEINTSSPQMQAVLMQLVLERRVGDYVMPKGWVIVAAGNRVADRAAAQKMPTALRNRFKHIHVCVDFDAWRKWATESGVAQELVAFLAWKKDFLHVMPKGDENAFPTPRSWVDISDFVDDPEDREQLIAGSVGDAYAAEFEAFIELYHSIGSLDGIVADPDNSPVPTEPSIRYSTCVGLARVATRQNFPSILRYAKRLAREFEILLVTDATHRDPKLKDISAYGKWAIDNQDITAQAA